MYLWEKIYSRCRINGERSSRFEYHPALQRTSTCSLCQRRVKLSILEQSTERCARSRTSQLKSLVKESPTLSLTTIPGDRSWQREADHEPHERLNTQQRWRQRKHPGFINSRKSGQLWRRSANRKRSAHRERRPQTSASARRSARFAKLR